MIEVTPWFQVLGVLVSIAVVIGGVWWKLQNQITQNQSIADQRLYEFKIQIAEQYVTKTGLTEQTDRLMREIEGLGIKIDRTNERMDQAFMPNPKPTSSRALK